MTKFIFSFGLILYSIQSIAHPVSFKDSLGIMGHHSPMMIHNQVNYSLEYWWALGVHHVQNPQNQDLKATYMTSNFLLKRWNGLSYQGNLYALVGGGISSLDGTYKGSGVAGVQFDIEDRKYYFLAKHLQVLNQRTIGFQQQYY